MQLTEYCVLVVQRLVMDIKRPIAQVILASINNMKYKNSCQLHRLQHTTPFANNRWCWDIEKCGVAFCCNSLSKHGLQHHYINKTVAYYKITNSQKSIERRIKCVNPYTSEIIILHKSQWRTKGWKKSIKVRKEANEKWTQMYFSFQGGKTRYPHKGKLY